jgi:hypothetical protein
MESAEALSEGASTVKNEKQEEYDNNKPCLADGQSAARSKGRFIDASHIQCACMKRKKFWKQESHILTDTESGSINNI